MFKSYHAFSLDSDRALLVNMFDLKYVVPPPAVCLRSLCFWRVKLCWSLQQVFWYVSSFIHLSIYCAEKNSPWDDDDVSAVFHFRLMCKVFTTRSILNVGQKVQFWPHLIRSLSLLSLLHRLQTLNFKMGIPLSSHLSLFHKNKFVELIALFLSDSLTWVLQFCSSSKVAIIFLAASRW